MINFFRTCFQGILDLGKAFIWRTGLGTSDSIRISQGFLIILIWGIDFPSKSIEQRKKAVFLTLVSISFLNFDQTIFSL